VSWMSGITRPRLRPGRTNGLLRCGALRCRRAAGRPPHVVPPPRQSSSRHVDDGQVRAVLCRMLATFPLSQPCRASTHDDAASWEQRRVFVPCPCESPPMRSPGRGSRCSTTSHRRPATAASIASRSYTSVHDGRLKCAPVSRRSVSRPLVVNAVEQGRANCVARGTPDAAKRSIEERATRLPDQVMRCPL
jgi:hypothetical protein